MSRLRSALVCCTVLVVLAGCSSNDGNQSANYVEFPDAGSVAPVDNPATSSAATSTDQTTDASTASTGPSAPVAEITAVVDVFDSFLALRAQAITGEVELSQLESVATAAAIDQVALLRSENDTRIANDSYAVRTDIAEWSNITLVQEGETDLRFRDCTESQYLTPGGFTVVNFVTNDVSMVDVDGQLKVNAVVVAQDGVASTSDEILGCVPESFLDRATGVAAVAVEEAQRLIENPGPALAEGLPPIFADQARVDLEAGLQSLSNEGLSRVADEIVDYTVLGMDVNRPDFTVVVSVCRTYPTGRSYVDVNGAETTAELAIGSSYEEWVYVHLQAVPSGGVPDVVTEVHERGPNCERG